MPKTQNFPGASTPGPPPGTLPLYPTGTLRRAPGPNPLYAWSKKKKKKKSVLILLPGRLQTQVQPG